MKVVYGHTDSIYVQCESIDKAKRVCEHINEEVQKIFPNVFNLEEHPVQLEFEKYFQSLGVGYTKNRNAGLISWKDDKDLEELEFTMTGFTAKRVSETQLAKDTQIAVLRMWVENKTEDEITKFLNETFNDVRSGEVDIQKVLKRTRYKESRFNVICKKCKDNNWNHKFTLHELSGIKTKQRICCNKPDFRTTEGKRPTVGSGIEGVLFHDTIAPNNIKDSYLFLKIQRPTKTYVHPLNREIVRPTYISVSTIGELDDFNFQPDWQFYSDSVVKKAEPIYKAMGWDLMNIKRDRNQTTLDGWFT
jgi:DNA polymerase elongation subunit (family B)